MKRIFLMGTALLAGLFMAVSCGTSTRVVSSWQAPSTPVTALDKVLVLGMMSDRQAKDQIERALVADFAERGVYAVSGTTEFGPRGFGNMTQEQVNRKLDSEGFTSIMIVCLTDKDKSVNYVPGTPYISPYGPRYYGYYGRYMYMYDNIYSPGYYTTSTTYVLDADLYSIPSDQLLYSAQTRSYDPANSRDLAESFSEEIVKDLWTKGFFI